MGALYQASRVAERWLPGPLVRTLRAVGTATVTPLLFSCRTGHLRSSLLNRAVDCRGEPIPWYTYPAIDFLASKSFERRSVLEWGAGQSTIWWAQRAAHVVALEEDPVWYERIRSVAPANAAIYLVDDRLDRYRDSLPMHSFDIIVIDGFDRFECARLSLGLLKDEGALVLDDSQGFWGVDGTYPIIDLLYEEGFQRVDFYGYAPGVHQAHCTSVFFQDRCFLFRGDQPPCRT